MKLILENGARPVLSLGGMALSQPARSVDWARSFSSLTPRKCHGGRSPSAPTRIAGCARSFDLLETRGWKNVLPKIGSSTPTIGAPPATHPLHPGEQDPAGSPEFVAGSPNIDSLPTHIMNRD